MRHGAPGDAALYQAANSHREERDSLGTIPRRFTTHIQQRNQTHIQGPKVPTRSNSMQRLSTNSPSSAARPRDAAAADAAYTDRRLAGFPHTDNHKPEGRHR